MFPEPTFITDGQYRCLADQNWARSVNLRSMHQAASSWFCVIPGASLFFSGGTLERTWHHPRLTSVHGLCVVPDDSLFIVPVDAHQVLKFSRSGELLLEFGEFNGPNWSDPFNHPTDVTDGYGNARVHRFAGDSTYICG